MLAASCSGMGDSPLVCLGVNLYRLCHQRFEQRSEQRAIFGSCRSGRRIVDEAVHIHAQQSSAEGWIS